MLEHYEQLLQYVRGIWLKRRYIVIVSWILCHWGGWQLP